jgi:predicted flap endonuclease-1-like 5' DNA nuclease
VTWFINQSLLFIVVAFLLGLLVGYLWWGRQVRRIRTEETTTTPMQPLAATAAEPAPVVEAEPVVEAAAEPEPVAEPVAEPEPVVEPEPVAEPVAAAASEPVAEVASEPVAEVAAEPEPVAAAEPEPEPAAVPVPEVSDELVADVESAFAATPVALTEPQTETQTETETRAEDDLTRIEGIGPKIAAALKAAGITTYAALADAERATLEDALANANLRFAPSIGSWSRQARLLADGKEEEFKALTDYLIAGREPTPKKTAAVAEPAAEPEPVVVAKPEAVVAAEPEPVVVEPVVVEPVVAAEPEPVVAAVAVDDGPPDNLQRIEGIGPKMSAALVAAGIRTYGKLAESDVDTLREAIEAADLRFAPSIVTWARQARLLADGKEAEFKELTDWLIAGREPTAKPLTSTEAGGDA